MNKGTGAGGANTNRTGLSFEAQTNNVPYLEHKGFTKVTMGKGATLNYLQLITKDKEIYYKNKIDMKVKCFEQPSLFLQGVLYRVDNVC